MADQFRGKISYTHMPPEPVRGNHEKFLGARRRDLPKGIAWGVAGLVVLFIAGIVFTAYRVKNDLRDSAVHTAGTLREGLTDLQRLDLQSAQNAFGSAASDAATPPGSDVFAEFGALLKKTSGAFGSLQDASKNLNALSEDIGQAEKGLVSLVAEGKGADLLAALQNIRKTIASLDADSNALSQVSSYLAASGSGGSDSSSGLSNGAASGLDADSYLAFKTKIQNLEQFLDAFIPWFSGAEPHHVLVMLENPSEMRAAGGFLGSYVDVTLANGNIAGAAAHDIADVDRAFSENIIPPKPLQLETSRFRPADANWFFDFPTSAAKTIELFEASKLYSATATPTIFDAAVAISPKVVSDLLRVTGPVTVPEEKTTFTADNLLVEIQKIVQAGQAQSATYPKKVLGELMQTISGRIASSTPEERTAIFSQALDWFQKKDMMIYFKNENLQRAIHAYGASGDVYVLPDNADAEYLAVVNTNIRGDKSDAYVSQDVHFESRINADGTAANHLVIQRTHTGDESPYWWYQTANQDYLQIFTSPQSIFENADGGVAKTIVPPVNYTQKKYLTDPTILSIETSTKKILDYPSFSSHEESGKEVFSTWVAVKAGASASTSLDYSHRLFIPPADGVPYRFIFEKQAGAAGHYHFEIDAPLGFKFDENGLSSYIYDSSDPPGRLIISLTLRKI